jgi:hypothetical protein
VWAAVAAVRARKAQRSRGAPKKHARRSVKAEREPAISAIVFVGSARHDAGRSFEMESQPQRRLVMSGMLLCLAVALSSAALAQERVAQHGVHFPLPPALRDAPELATTPAIAAAYSDGAGAPLQLVVLTAAAISGEAYRAAAQQGPSALAQQAAGALKDQLQLAEVYEVQPAAYDELRDAVHVSFKAHNASQASVIMAQPDASPAWDQVRSSGQDPRVLKCLLTHLLGDARFATRAELQVKVPDAAERCGWPVERVERFLDMAGAAVFAPIESSMASLTFYTRGGVVNLLVAGPASRERDVQAAAKALWAEATVDPSVRLGNAWYEPLRALAASPGGRMAWTALGAVVAVFLVGGLLAWLLGKVRVPQRWAVGIALAVMISPALLGWVRAGAPSADEAATLLCYLLASGLAFRPLNQWLAARATPRAGE